MTNAPASAIYKTASREIGYKELGKNRTKYWSELKPGFQGSPWCAAFVEWVLKQNGMWLDAPLPYSTGSMMRYAKANGMWIPKGGTRKPKHMDIVIYGRNGTAQHTGFHVAPASLGRNVSIEGNTSSGLIGSQSNGDGVYRRVRLTGWVLGWISMPYGPEPVVVPPPAPAVKYAKYPGHQHFNGGPNDLHVKQIQTALTKAGHKVTVDGRFGPKTTAAVKSFQRSKKVTADGFVGPKTWALLKIPA